jgi:hypothetical protein
MDVQRHLLLLVTLAAGVGTAWGQQVAPAAAPTTVGADSAEVLPGATCPPDFNCLPPEPRDRVCRHPALVFEKEIKAMRYDGDQFSPAYEKACIAHANSSVVRRGGELRLKFENGRSKVYKDSWGKAACEEGRNKRCEHYVFYDYFPDSKLFLVHVDSWETQGWFLVSQLDGKEKQIVAAPGYSPNRKWLASVYGTDGPDDVNNGIDIVPASLRPTERAFHYRPKDYELWKFIGWDADDRLLLKVTWWVGNDLVAWPAEVVRVNGEWQLNRWPPTSSRP